MHKKKCTPNKVYALKKVRQKKCTPNPRNRRFAPIRLFLYMSIKNYITERYSLPKALLLYLKDRRDKNLLNQRKSLMSNDESVI